MQAFRRYRGQVACHFEPAEIELLESLLGQFIELLCDQHGGPSGPGTRHGETPTPSDDPSADLFEQLEREMSGGSAEYFDAEPAFDPVIKRLFPDAYPTDAEASYDFQRFTQTAQRSDKVSAAQQMLADLRLARGTGRCAVPDPHTTAWLKSLTNIRLALAVRMGIEQANDAEELAELPDDDPRSWVYAIYEWAGWVQESLLAAQD